MKFKTLLIICCVLTFKVENKNNYCLKKLHQPTNPNRIGLVWFGFYFKSQANQTKPHIYLSYSLDNF